MTSSAPERYVRLGLQLGRHVEGIVDAYFGPPELAAAVDAERPVDPRELVSAADLLLDAAPGRDPRDLSRSPHGALE